MAKRTLAVNASSVITAIRDTLIETELRVETGYDYRHVTSE